MLMSCPNITNGMNYCLTTKSASLKCYKREEKVPFFAFLMSLGGEKEVDLIPLVNIFGKISVISFSI